MARPMIKEACMASLLLENPYYILQTKSACKNKIQSKKDYGLQIGSCQVPADEQEWFCQAKPHWDA